MASKPGFQAIRKKSKEDHHPKKALTPASNKLNGRGM
jgi:hypothetical protein